MADSWLSKPAQEPAPWPHLVVILILVLLGATAMLSSSAIVDTARDVFNAWQISTASDFPMEGPFMASAFHSGPVWFYILSLPLLFTTSWTVLSFWVGLLTGIKYVLAYLCGSRLGDRNFGLLWAALLALPNWTSINYLIFSHTNLIETLVLASFYCLIRWQQGEVRWFVLMCLALSLALHAHPTTLAIAVAVGPLVIFDLLRRHLSWRWLLAGTATALMPWLPYLISQQLQHWPDIHNSGDHIASLSFWHNLSGVHHLAWGTLVDAPLLILRTFFELEGFWLALSFALILLLYAGGLGLAGWSAWKSGIWRIPAALLFVTIVSMVVVASLRNITQYYLVLLVYPSFFGLIAWGWSQWLDPWRMRLLGLVSVAAIFTLAAFTFANVHIGQMGNAMTPLRALLDVRSHATDEFNDSVIFPAWARDELADFVCHSDSEPVFHGYASMVLEMSYGLEIRMQCPDKNFHIGGAEGQQHYLGVSQRDAELLGIESSLRIGPMHLFEPQHIHSPNPLLQVPTGDIYPPYQSLFDADQRQQHRFSTGSRHWLVITNLFHFWMQATVEVKLNETIIEPTLRTSLQSYYFCQDCSENEDLNWSVTINAPKPELVEVVSFSSGQDH